MSSLIPRHHAQLSIFGSTSDVSWLRAQDQGFLISGDKQAVPI